LVSRPVGAYLDNGLLPSPMGWAIESRTFGAYLNAIALKGLHTFDAPYPARCAGLLNHAPSELFFITVNWD